MTKLVHLPFSAPATRTVCFLGMSAWGDLETQSAIALPQLIGSFIGIFTACGMIFRQESQFISRLREPHGRRGRCFRRHRLDRIFAVVWKWLWGVSEMFSVLRAPVAFILGVDNNEGWALRGGVRAGNTDDVNEEMSGGRYCRWRGFWKPSVCVALQ